MQQQALNTRVWGAATRAESEVRLIKRCRELNAEIVANAAKVQTALKLNEEDQGTIATLKKEIEKAWKLVDASHEKEAKAKETIQQLKLEISNLTRLVEQGSGLAMGEESTLNDLLKQKEELVRERDAQVDQIMALRADLMETQVSPGAAGRMGATATAGQSSQPRTQRGRGSMELRWEG